MVGAMPPAEASPPPPDEHFLLTTAVRRLRTAHDPASALAALDDYRARFPGGVLAPEAPCCARRRSYRLAAKATRLLSWMAVARSDAQQRRASRSAGELRAAVGPGEKPWQISTSSCAVTPGGGRHRHATRCESARTLGTRLVGRAWPAAAWATTLAHARICASVSALSARTLRSEAARLLGEHR